jgi:hypothetical protein
VALGGPTVDEHLGVVWNRKREAHSAAG